MRRASTPLPAKLSAVLGMASPLLVLAAAMGAGANLIGFDFAFGVLTLQWAWWLALAGLGLGLLALVLSLKSLRRAWPWLAVGLLVPGLTLAAFVWQQQRAAALPPVHEVATAWQPALVLSREAQARRAGAPNPVEPHPRLPADLADRNPAWAPYAGRRVAEVNAETCPGARTIPRLVPPEEVIAALKAEGVRVFGQAPWRVEGVQESPWYGRARDVVVRMQPGATDIRSVERVGLIDLGQNCRLVTSLVERLED